MIVFASSKLQIDKYDKKLDKAAYIVYVFLILTTLSTGNVHEGQNNSNGGIRGHNGRVSPFTITQFGEDDHLYARSGGHPRSH